MSGIASQDANEQRRKRGRSARPAGSKKMNVVLSKMALDVCRKVRAGKRSAWISEIIVEAGAGASPSDGGVGGSIINVVLSPAAWSIVREIPVRRRSRWISGLIVDRAAKEV